MTMAQAYETKKTFEGIVRNLDRRWRGDGERLGARGNLEIFLHRALRHLRGLSPEARGAGGEDRRQPFGQVGEMSVRSASAWFEDLPGTLSDKQNEIAARILKEIRERLRFLMDVGLEYLTLGRSSGTLSGGESQRIRLASQIGSGLSGVLYVLDEPSIACTSATMRACWRR